MSFSIRSWVSLGIFAAVLEFQVEQFTSLLDVEIWCHLSVALCGGLTNGTVAPAWPLEFCLGESCPLVLTLMPDTSVSPPMPLAPFQLLPPRGSESVWVLSLLWSFKKWHLRISFFHCPTSHWFLPPEVVGIYLPGTGTLGSGISCFWGIPPDFYPRVGVGLLVPGPCLSCLTGVTSLTPWLWDFHTAPFCDDSGW